MKTELFTEEEIQAIFEATDGLAAEFIRKLPEHMAKLLDDALITAIGFTRRYGKLEIDHQSTASKLIRERATQAIGELVTKQLDQLRATTEKSMYRTCIQTEFTRAYRDEFRSTIIAIARQQAQADAKTILAKLAERKLRKLDGFKKELADPDSYCTEMGELILEEMVTSGKLPQ